MKVVGTDQDWYPVNRSSAYIPLGLLTSVDITYVIWFHRFVYALSRQRDGFPLANWIKHWILPLPIWIDAPDRWTWTLAPDSIPLSKGIGWQYRVSDPVTNRKGICVCSPCFRTPANTILDEHSWHGLLCEWEKHDSGSLNIRPST